MKKLGLILAALVLLGASAFALEADYTLSASAALEIGYDLDAEDYFISSSADASLTVSFTDIPEGEAGEGSVYGWISVTGASIEIASVGSADLDDDDDDIDADTPDYDEDDLVLTNPSVEAKLYLGPVAINILGQDDAIDSASLAQGFADSALTTSSAVSVDASPDTYGFSLELTDSSVVGAVLGFTTSADSDNDNDNTYGNGTNDFYVYGSVALNAVEMLDLSVGFTIFDGEIGLGVATGLSIGDLLGFGVGFDTDLTDHEIGAGVELTVAGITLGAGTSIEINGSGDTYIDISADVTTGDLLPLTITGYFDLADLSEATTYGMGMAWGVGLSGSFGDAIGITVALDDTDDPSNVDDNDTDDSSDDTLSPIDSTELSISVDLTVIDNTTFTLGWSGADLDGDSIGIISFTTTISL